MLWAALLALLLLISNLCMEVVEELAINTSTVTPRIWKRYVDDSFVIIKKDAVSSFHDTLNSIDPKIAFTIEEENNGQISFLDTLVSRKNGVTVIDVYRKPTHTDRYLDYSSHHEYKHKVSAASTLLFRAANLPSTYEGKARETSYVTEALKANGYPPTVISNILKKKSAPTTPPPEELVSMFFKWADPSDTSLGFACLPYIRGLTEPLTRLLRKNYIRVVSKPAKTLQQEFPSPKFRQPLDLQCNVVYKISCADCCWSYVGETGRCFKTRRKEHQRNLKNYTRGSNIANHAWQNNHSIDFDGATVIDKGNYHIRRTLVKNPGILPKLSAQTIILNRYQDNTLSYCNSYFVRFCPFLAFLHFYCILVFNLFTPSLAYISNHALPFLFTFVKGYSIIAESLYFS